MHATIRRYRGGGAKAAQVTPKVTQGLLPTLRQAPGFVAYCAYASEDGDISSISLFETREASESMAAKAREWVQANLRELLPNAPEIEQGEVMNQDLAPLGAGGGGEGQIFVRLNRYRGLGAPAAEVRRRAEQEVMPPMRAARGFRGYFNFVADRDPGLGIAASFWQSREAATEWGETFARTLLPRMQDLLPNPPEPSFGMSLVLAMARGPERSPGA